MPRQPEDIQTLHAELLEQMTAMEAGRAIGHLSGSFTTKEVSGQKYAYFQYSEPGGQTRQIYLGSANANVREAITRWRNHRSNAVEDTAQIERLCGMLRGGGGMMLPKPVVRVLKSLSDAAVFRLGGVLVGTHAFAALGNLLGHSWEGAVWRTEDIDVAATQRITLALSPKKTDIPRALDSLEMGFVPVPRFDHDEPSTSFKVRGRPLRVDLLTSGGRSATRPMPIPRFQTTAQPLRFLDYAIAGYVPAVATDGRHAVLINVPRPARFALHKLLVTQLRPAYLQTKAIKDLKQAALMIRVIAEDRPLDLEEAAQAIRARRDGALGTLRKAITQLRRSEPEAAEQLRGLVA